MRHDVGIVEVPKCPESRSAAASVYALLESVFNLDEVPLHRTGLAQPNGQAAKQGDPLCVCVCVPRGLRLPVAPPPHPVPREEKTMHQSEHGDCTRGLGAGRRLTASSSSSSSKEDEGRYNT